MKLVIVSFGHADSILHYAKTMSNIYCVELIFVFALNKRKESVLNFENEKIHTGFLNDKQTNIILGKPIRKFISGDFKVRFYINHNLKIRSLKNIILSWNLAKYLKNFDIIHFNGIDATLILDNIFLRKRKKVFTIHDVKLHSGENSGKSGNIAEKICLWIIKSKHQTIIQNKYDFNEVLNHFPDKKEKLNFIPFKCLSIFREYENLNLPAEKSDILFFGRISLYKGLKYLIEAYEIIKNTIPDVKLLIAGGGNIKNEISELNKNENIKIINRYISNEELVNFIINTKIIVCPYTDATQSGVVMTSFAFNKPVIATSVGGFVDVIDNNVTGKLVPPRNSKMLADAIVELLSNKRELNEMSDKIKEECNNGKLSWNSICNDAKQMYSKALNS